MIALDAVLPHPRAVSVADVATLTSVGLDGLWSREAGNDPFLDLCSVAQARSVDTLGTNIAVAFARSPFSMAASAWQMQAMSGGRFVLGLGSQVKGHITGRYGMPYDPPGPKLREYILAVREIWNAFRTGEISHEGAYYRFDKRTFTPYFTPPPNEHANPPIVISAVNKYNCETVGRVADGMVIHPLHSSDFIRSELIPMIDVGLAASRRQRSDLTLICPVLVGIGESTSELTEARRRLKSSIAFYGSTRTYASVFEALGRPRVPERLHALMAKGRVDDMPDAVDDDLLDEIAIVGTVDHVAQEMRTRYDGLVDRVYISNQDENQPLQDEETLRRFIRAFREKA